MYADVSFMISLIMIVSGLWLLTWSANRFVDGAATLSQKFGVSPFIIGMVVIGFGTSAPEMAVSALSAASGHSDLSLGNAKIQLIFHFYILLVNKFKRGKNFNPRFDCSIVVYICQYVKSRLPKGSGSILYISENGRKENYNTLHILLISPSAHRNSCGNLSISGGILNQLGVHICSHIFKILDFFL